MSNDKPEPHSKEAWPQPQAWSWPSRVSASVLAGSQVTSGIVCSVMQWLSTYCLLGTEDAHLQQVRESWGRQGDKHVVTTPVRAPGKGATSGSSGERVGTGGASDPGWARN